MNINLPKNVKFILDTLKVNGYESYIVGGCVRDTLMGLNPKDWDIITNALPEQIKNIFSDFEIINIGEKYGTIGVLIKKQIFEITTYRREGLYYDNRHPENIEFVNNLKDSLYRRDFTINAIAYNEQEGLIDYFEGRKHIEQKIIKCVGNPDDRFKEDALRIMRALRFASVLEFEIESLTSESLKKNKDMLKNIAVERISVEFNKLLLGNNVKKILIDYSDIIGVFIPEIIDIIGLQQHTPYHIYDVWQHTVHAIEKASNDLIIRLSLFFHDIGKSKVYSVDENNNSHFYRHEFFSKELTTNILKRLKYDNETINQVVTLVYVYDIEIKPTNKSIKKVLNKIDKELFEKLIKIKYCDTMAQSRFSQMCHIGVLKDVEEMYLKVIEDNECFKIKDLTINGDDLIKLGFNEGVEIGVVLDKILSLVIQDKLDNTKSSLLNYVKIYKMFNNLDKFE